MNIAFNSVLIACLLTTGSLLQSAMADEEADRKTMRGMLADVEAAINARDLSTVIDFFLPDSVVVFQNKTVLTGPGELEDFYNKMLGSTDSILKDVSSTTAISAPATFYGPDTAVAHGTVVDNYAFRGGSSMQLESAWTTSLVRIDDQWRVASLHLSANIFDNPLIAQSRKWIPWAGIGGLVIGSVVTWLITRRRKKPTQDHG